MATGQSCGEVKNAFHNFKVSVTGRYAVSLPVFLLIVPFGFLVALEREEQLNPTSPTSHSVLSVTFGFFACFLYIFIAQATLLKDRKKAPQSLWKCFFVWYSTGLVQGMGAAIYAHFAFGLDWDLRMRLSMTTFYIGTALSLISFYFGTIERRRIEDQALQSLEQLLAIDQGEMVSTDAEARSQALSVLKKVLKPQIEKLQALIISLKNSDGNQAQELKAISEEISQAIDNEANAVQRNRNIKAKAATDKKRRISFLSGIFPRNLSVRISVLLIAFGSFTGQFPRNGVDGVVAGLIGTLLIAIVLIILSKLVKSHQDHNRRTYILLSYLTVFLTQAIWTFFQGDLGFELRNPYNPLYSATKTLYGVYIASIVSSLIIETTRSFENSKNQSEILRGEIAFLAREKEILDQHIHATRFGTLQGKISGVIMALQLIDATTKNSQHENRREELIENANALLSDALREIEELGKASAR